MALGMLQPLNPTSRGLADLSGGEPSVLDIAMKRKEMELDLGKQAAAERMAKEKAAQDTQAKLEKLPQTVKLEHTRAYGKLYNATQQRIGQILKANGGVTPAAGTPEWDEYNALTQNLAQVADNSIQLDKRRAELLAEFDKNQNLYPGITRGQLEAYGTPEDMLSGNLPDNPLDKSFDLAAYAEPFFSKIKPDQMAWAYPGRDGGAYSGSNEMVAPDDIKAVAEGLAINPAFDKAAQQQFKSFSPEKQEFIKKLAVDNNMTIPAAIALDFGTGLEKYVKQERSYTQPGSAAMGQADKAASARELLETGFGIAGGAAQGRSIREVSPEADRRVTEEFLETYPNARRFSVDGQSILTNYNNLYYDTKVGADGKKIPAKIRGIVRNPSDGSVRVAYSTDDDGTDVTITEKIPQEEFYSKVIRRIALNTPEYDINTLDRIAQDEYKLIEGSGGQINLPARGPVFNVPKNNKPSGLNFNVPK